MKFLITLTLISLSLSASAQHVFPKSLAEDKNKIMSEKYWKKWNPTVQAKIDADIEKNRKADAKLNFNELQEGTEILIEQIGHDFIFGAHLFNYNQLGSKDLNNKYKNLYGTLFNSATVAFYWKDHEMQPNRLRFNEENWDTEDYWNNVSNPKAEPHWRRPASDPVVEFCENKGIRIHGHPIIFGSRRVADPKWLVEEFATENEKQIIKSWVKEFGHVQRKRQDITTEEYKDLPPKEIEERIPAFTKLLKEKFETRVERLASHYGDRIHSWDVVNESAADFSLGRMIPGDGICKSFYGIMPGDYTYMVFKKATELFPKNVKLNINDFKSDISYVEQVKDLKSRGCKVDIIGLQMHLFNPKQCLDIAAGANIQSPDTVWKRINTLSQADIPIHISEITITSPGNDKNGEQIQAIIAQNLYRLWFSAEKMMGITWWNVVDDCGAPGEPSISGLFTRDMRPKYSYFALNNLINNEWKTVENFKLTRDKAVNFRGFKGKYRVSWKDKSGNTVFKEFYLKNNGDGFKKNIL